MVLTVRSCHSCQYCNSNSEVFKKQYKKPACICCLAKYGFTFTTFSAATNCQTLKVEPGAGSIPWEEALISDLPLSTCTQQQHFLIGTVTQGHTSDSLPPYLNSLLLLRPRQCDDGGHQRQTAAAHGRRQCTLLLPQALSQTPSLTFALLHSTPYPLSFALVAAG